MRIAGRCGWYLVRDWLPLYKPKLARVELHLALCAEYVHYFCALTDSMLPATVMQLLLSCKAGHQAISSSRRWMPRGALAPAFRCVSVFLLFFECQYRCEQKRFTSTLNSEKDHQCLVYPGLTMHGTMICFAAFLCQCHDCTFVLRYHRHYAHCRAACSSCC